MTVRKESLATVHGMVTLLISSTLIPCTLSRLPLYAVKCASLLVLANKQDLAGALSVEEISKVVISCGE